LAPLSRLVVRRVVNRKEVAVMAAGRAAWGRKGRVLAPNSVAKFDVSGGPVARVPENT